MYFLAETSIPSWLLEGDLMGQVVKFGVIILFWILGRYVLKGEKWKGLIKALQHGALVAYEELYKGFKEKAKDGKLTKDEKKQLFTKLKEEALKVATPDVKKMILGMAPDLLKSTADMVVAGLQKLGGKKK